MISSPERKTYTQGSSSWNLLSLRNEKILNPARVRIISLIAVTLSSRGSLLALTGIITPYMSMCRFGRCGRKEQAFQGTGDLN